MAFPWELNLDRPYRDEKWPFPEQRARGESTDSVFGGSAEKLDGFPADSENRQGTAEGSDPESPGKRKPRASLVPDFVDADANGSAPLAQPGVDPASMFTALRP